MPEMMKCRYCRRAIGKLNFKTVILICSETDNLDGNFTLSHHLCMGRTTELSYSCPECHHRLNTDQDLLNLQEETIAEIERSRNSFNPHLIHPEETNRRRYRAHSKRVNRKYLFATCPNKKCKKAYFKDDITPKNPGIRRGFMRSHTHTCTCGTTIKFRANN